MGELADVTGADLSVSINGKTYKLAPLSMNDFGELEQYYETLPLRNVKAAVDILDREEDRRYLLDKAYREMQSGNRNIYGKEGAAFMETLRGVLYVIYLSLRKGGHTELTVESVGELFKMSNLNDLYQIADKISGATKIDNALSGGDDNGNPTTANQDR